MEEFEQMGLLEATYEPFVIKNKIRLIELFGGNGSLPSGEFLQKFVNIY